MIQETSENKEQNLLRISFFKINSFLSNIFPVLEFLNFLAIRELSYIHYISLNGIAIELGFSFTLKVGLIQSVFAHVVSLELSCYKSSFL